MNSSPITPRMLTIPMVAKYLSATNWFVEELIRNKELPAQKFGKSYVVDLHDINAWIEERKKSEGLKELMANARIMTDEEAQEFFATVPRTRYGDHWVYWGGDYIPEDAKPERED